MSLNHNRENQCPICGQGELLVVKDCETSKFLIICDDCESQWDNPDDSQHASRSILDEYVRVDDATQDEIKNLGWTQFIKGDI